MNNLTDIEKIAVLRILTDIVIADHLEHKKEVEYINGIAKSFGFDSNYKELVDNMLTLQALTIIKEMSPEVKSEIAKMMGKMIIIDDDINYNEVKCYNTVCDSCMMTKEFNVDDYPDLSISGFLEDGIEKSI